MRRHESIRQTRGIGQNPNPHHRSRLAVVGDNPTQRHMRRNRSQVIETKFNSRASASGSARLAAVAAAQIRIIKVACLERENLTITHERLASLELLKSNINSRI